MGNPTPHSPGDLPADDGTDLHYHGDQDLIPDTINFAVNVHPEGPPQWLRDAMDDVDLTAYPDPSDARDALANHWGIDAKRVLPTAGAAEAFTLLARAWSHRRWCVVHPQFTEPEAALRIAKASVHRHVLSPATGFRIDPERLLSDINEHRCDVVIFGNPTNPTGVLHSLDTVIPLISSGVQIVIDEAFLDSAPQLSAVGGDVVVIRSLTKLWGIPGVRAGWLDAPPSITAELARFQTPWSVSAAANAAIIATASEAGELEGAKRVAKMISSRTDLALRLITAGFEIADRSVVRDVQGSSVSHHDLGVSKPSPAPFLLVNTGSQRSLYQPLSEQGFSLRRGETFPGLGPSWLRLAIRSPSEHQGVVSALKHHVVKPHPSRRTERS